jgi:hypothetical protein
LDPLLGYWKNSSYRNWRFRKYIRLQKYFEKIAKRFKNRTIGFGDYNNATGSCIRAKKGPIIKLKRFLKRKKINMINVDENKTSKLCHKCYKILGNYDPKTKRITHFESEFQSQWPSEIETTITNKNKQTRNVRYTSVLKNLKAAYHFQSLKVSPNDKCNNLSRPKLYTETSTLRLTF